MSIRPSGRKRSVLQVLSDGMRSNPPTGKSCCEEAQLTANELARRNEELSEAEDEIAALTKRAEKAEAERDELQRKLDAAEQRTPLDREAVQEAISAWLHSPSTEIGDLTEAILALATSVPTNDDEQRVEEQAKALHDAIHPFGPSWEGVGEYVQRCYITAIRAGWTPPESEDDQ